MNPNRKFTRRRRHLSVLEQLTERFEAKDDSWYAQRLELLGLALFGDLWEPDKPKTATENP